MKGVAGRGQVWWFECAASHRLGFLDSWTPVAAAVWEV